MISLAVSESEYSTSEPILTFSGNAHSRRSLALVFCKNNDIELKSFTDIAIDERAESEATESKFQTEVEENSVLTNCHFFILIFWLR